MRFLLFNSHVNNKKNIIITPKRDKPRSGPLKIELNPHLRLKSSTEKTMELSKVQYEHQKSKILTKVNPKTKIVPIF